MNKKQTCRRISISTISHWRLGPNRVLLRLDLLCPNSTFVIDWSPRLVDLGGKHCVLRLPLRKGWLCNGNRRSLCVYTCRNFPEIWRMRIAQIVTWLHQSHLYHWFYH